MLAGLTTSENAARLSDGADHIEDIFEHYSLRKLHDKDAEIRSKPKSDLQII